VSQPQSAYRNRIIRALAPEDFERLSARLSPVRLDLRMDLELANQPIVRVCFPDSGIISVVARSEGLNTIEVGLVGREGMTGLAVVMGETQSPQDTYVQVAGAGHWLESEALSALLDIRPAMRQLMASYAHVFTTQIAQTALANGRAKIDARLARWLLMAADRFDEPDMPLTHELLALMLGVRRPGVTDALHRLEGEHMIRARRASITLRDRAALEAVADGYYGVPEAEYRRVCGGGQTPAPAPLRVVAPA
jgi:CRP-like cAMP-binding protein